MPDRPLAAFLNPRSIAVIGASGNANKIGGRPLVYLSRFGFTGRVYPINPHRSEVQGFRSYESLDALPEAPDLAIIAMPGPAAIEAVGACAARGVKAVIVMSSGFAETAETSGIAAERGMVARARDAGMRIVGPNSQGLANFGTGAVASFSTMFLEVEPADGPVGIVSQSGMMSVVPYGLLRAQGIGVRHAHATGNDADVSLAELALAVVQDPAVRLLLLYIESIRDAASLARVAEAARLRDVPIVAVKAGRTAGGQAAARSHTAALVNEDRVVDEFFRQHGIWRARDMHDLVGAAELYLKGWRPSGRRLTVLSNSGASCVMAADGVQNVNLELATFGPATVDALAAELPAFVTAANPVDLTAALLTKADLFGNVLSILSREPAMDSLLIALPVAGAGYDVPSYARAAAEFAAITGKPVVVAAPQDTVRARFHEAGVPVFANQTDAMGALGQIGEHVRLMRRARPVVRPLKPIAVPPGPSRFLSEAESLSFLEGLGLPVVPHHLCHSGDDAIKASRAIGGPVAMKGCTADVPHKSEHGLVLLGVEGEQNVAHAFGVLQAKLREIGAAAANVIVAPMIEGMREVMLGAKVDPTFGPVLVMGDGGRYVEALGDTAMLLPPVSSAGVREALSTLRIAPLFDGVRGDAPLDVDALCDVAVRLGEIIVAGAGRIASIDLNPVMVGARGRGLVIVDAVVERTPE